MKGVLNLFLLGPLFPIYFNTNGSIKYSPVELEILLVKTVQKISMRKKITIIKRTKYNDNYLNLI